MKIHNTIKSAIFTYNLVTNKTFILAILFQFVISSFAWADNQYISILKQTLPIIQSEKWDDNITNLLQHNIDSIISTGYVSEKLFGKTIYEIGNQFREQGKLTKVIELYLKVIPYYEQKSDLPKDEISSLIEFYIPMGACHEELGLWSRAIDYYLKALSLSEKYKFEQYKAMIYNNIGALYYSRNDLNKAQNYTEKALEINKRLKNNKELFNNYNNLGGIYLQLNLDDRALDCALQAIQLLDSKKDAYLYYFMQTNIASLYVPKREYALAMSYLRNAMIHQEKLGFRSDLIQTYHLLSETFNQTGQKDSAFFYLNKAMKESKIQDNLQIESDLQRKLAGFYYTNGDYNKAYKALQASVILRDSLQAANTAKKINDMEHIYDVEKKMSESELLVKDITLQKVAANRLWIVTVAIAFCLIITIFVLIYHSKNKEKQRETQALLVQQKTALLEKEQELQKQKEEDLSYTLDQRNRKLTSYTLYMLKTNEFISDINEELKQLLLELNPKDRQHKAQIQNLQIKLQQQNSSNNWEEFRYYFEQVHPSFYKNLEELYPDLTIKEKRLCAFLCLGLSSKDIAAITFKEVRSVESARNRLRKKLNLSPEGNLTEFLSKDLAILI